MFWKCFFLFVVLQKELQGEQNSNTIFISYGYF